MIDDFCMNDITPNLRISSEKLESSKFLSYKSGRDDQTRGIAFQNFLDCIRIYNLITEIKSMCNIESRQKDININMEKYSNSLTPLEESYSHNENKSIVNEIKKVPQKERNQFDCMIKKLQCQIINKVKSNRKII